MILEKFKLNNKIAIVTGAGRGLGQAMAIGLAEAGADIVLVDLIDMKETADQIKNNGRQYLTIEADLLTTSSINKIVEATTEKFGHIDILLNNAGIITRQNFVDYTQKDWDDVMNVNLRTIFFLSQTVSRILISQGQGGKIINICSLLSFQGGILIPSYTASKSGLMGLTKALANELAPHRINVNGIAPGYIATKGNESLRNDPKRAPELLARIPAGRWGYPEDLQGAAVFLASEASDYVNGYTIAVDGAWLAR